MPELRPGSTCYFIGKVASSAPRAAPVSAAKTQIWHVFVVKAINSNLIDVKSYKPYSLCLPIYFCGCGHFSNFALRSDLKMRLYAHNRCAGGTGSGKTTVVNRDNK